MKDELKEIGTTLVSFLDICDCQRKIKSIIDCLASIHDKIINENNEFTDQEYLIIALLDSRGFLTHGTNIEYPILDKDYFWQWINKVRYNPSLKNN